MIDRRITVIVEGEEPCCIEGLYDYEFSKKTTIKSVINMIKKDFKNKIHMNMIKYTNLKTKKNKIIILKG